MSDEEPAQKEPPGPDVPLLLFVAATAPTALRAMHNLERCLRDNGIAAEAVEVVDVFREPGQALAWGVFATPTLVRRADPQARLSGDMADTALLARFLLEID